MAKMEQSKTWIFSPNIVIPNAGSQILTSQATMWRLKEEMVNTFGWTVHSSSNSVTVASSDLWVAPSNIVFGPGARGWIVLNMPFAGQLLIDCYANGASGDESAVYFSPGSLFSGGTTSVSPTSADKLTLVSTVAPRLFLSYDSANQRVLHLMQSSDGKNFRFVQMSGGKVYTFLSLEELQSPHANLQNGSVYSAYGSLSNGFTYANYQRGARYTARLAGVEVVAMLVTAGCSGLGLGEVWNVNDIDGNLPNLPPQVFSITAGNLAMLGNMQDMWMGPSLSVNTGDTYPSAALARQFMQFNHIIIPWDGSVPVVA